MSPIKGSVRNLLQLSCRDFLLSNVQIEKEQMCWSQVQFNETEIAAECLKNSTQLCEDTAIDGTNITVHKLLIWQVNLMKPNWPPNWIVVTKSRPVIFQWAGTVNWRKFVHYLNWSHEHWLIIKACIVSHLSLAISSFHGAVVLSFNYTPTVFKFPRILLVHSIFI